MAMPSHVQRPTMKDDITGALTTCGSQGTQRDTTAAEWD